MKTKNALPEGINQSDLKYPGYKSKDRTLPYPDGSFELWHITSFGWVIPTLFIRGAGRHSESAHRTYAVNLKGQTCRVGLGPHVTERVTVYVRKSREKVLRKFLDLKNTGAIRSNEIRDRISTRRAQTQARRRDPLGWLGGIT